MMIYPLIIIVMALIFDFYNGMNDAANSIATVVSTRVLTPVQAVMWAAFFNFIAAFAFGVGVAKTIGEGIVDTSVIDNTVILASLVGAIITTATATHMGFPISVSHAIIGGLAGSAFIKAGAAALVSSGIIKVFVFIFLAPIIGFFISIIFSVITLWIVRNNQPHKVDKYFRKLQLLSAGLYSLSHGSNDAQKTMGIITLVLFTNSMIPAFDVPFWVIISSHSVIALGTLIGGWKVIKTLGMRMTKLNSFGGFSAETSAGLTIVAATIFGIPVSTTHTITGSIAGVGILKGVGGLRWGVARNILWAWVLTIPLSCFFAIVSYKVITYILLLF
ncbi:MAG: inorganic phosphate transporter [bacterium]